MIEDGFVGFDGCNRYDGRSKDGAPIADADGRFSVQDGFRTEQYCPEPQGIMDQADAYISALWRGERFRIVDDRLEILDTEGVTRLVFVKQEEPLPEHPVELEGTGWRLLIEADAMDGARAPTLAFLDDRLVAGATACRSYVATFQASEGSLRFPGTSMVGSPQSCGKDARILECEFSDFLTWAREYSAHEEGGSIRLRIWSLRGKTLTFEPLPQAVEGIADTEWALVTFVEFRLDSGTWHHRITEVVQGSDVTIWFDGHGLEGFTGCNSYADPAEIEDGSITIDSQHFFSTLKLCETPDGLRKQEERYLDLVQRVTRHGIYGDALSLQTDNDVFLVFQAE